ncbi:MAG: DNA recombination protein RmuC [Clostridiales bacterium]|nr:DNA recombination protein RmuC [Clostridiales bacterium]
MEFYVIYALLAVLVILLAAAIAMISKLSKKQKEDSDNLNRSMSELSRDTAVLNGRNEQLARRIAEEFERSNRERIQFQENLRKATVDSMKTVFDQQTEMLKSNSEYQEKLIKILTSSLDSIRTNNIEQNERQSRIVSEAISKMQESNEKKLDQMRETVDEKLTATLTTRLNSSFKTVSDQLENVYKSLGEMKELSTGVTDNVTTLNRVLTNVKARGTWAEVQLGSILDQTIPNMYEQNFRTSPSSGEMVEFAVRIPSGGDSKQITYLPIDSKFPVEDYIRLCEAADRADADALSAAKKALEASVLKSAKDISKYINVPVTTPFAIMYLATEGLYAEIASSKIGLPERLQREYNIMIAGPTTITALLNSLSMGFRAVAINEKANEIRNLLAAAKIQYEKFGVVLDKAKKKIEEAGRSLEDAQKRNDIIHSKLKNVDELDMPRSEELLGIPETSDEE